MLIYPIDVRLCLHKYIIMSELNFNHNILCYVHRFKQSTTQHLKRFDTYYHTIWTHSEIRNVTVYCDRRRAHLWLTLSNIQTYPHINVKVYKSLIKCVKVTDICNHLLTYRVRSVIWNGYRESNRIEWIVLLERFSWTVLKVWIKPKWNRRRCIWLTWMKI